jgi:hypothetical protein
MTNLDLDVAADFQWRLEDHDGEFERPFDPKRIEGVPLEEHLAATLRGRGEIALTQLTLDTGRGQFTKGGIADVWAMTTSWSYRVAIYECKKTRVDYWSDVRSGKYKKYLDQCHRLYFAAMKGLIKVEELPEGAGLIELGQRGGWRIVKRGRYRPYRLPERQSLAVIFRLARGKTTTGGL